MWLEATLLISTGINDQIKTKSGCPTLGGYIVLTIDFPK